MTNKYQIRFVDKQTRQEYEVEVSTTGRVTSVAVQRNTLWLIGGGPIREGVEVNKLEQRLAETPIPVKVGQ